VVEERVFIHGFRVASRTRTSVAILLDPTVRLEGFGGRICEIVIRSSDVSQ
jgi:hypothetical protein